MHLWKSRIRKTAIVIVLLYSTIGIALYLAQDLLLFHPTRLPMDHRFRFDQPYEEMNIAVGGRNLNILKLSPNSEKKGAVLFLHGNMHHSEHYNRYPSFFTRNGYETWMIDYPGFGKSSGKRNEKTMYHDALLMYDSARLKYPAEKIVIYGKSIGTGVASYLASERDHARLVLETPYYSIDALARHYFPFYPVLPMTRYSFPVHLYLKNVSSSTTIFHGTEDEVIPFRQALRLKMEHPKVELVEIEGGRHNNLSGFERFQKKLDSLLSY